MIRTNFDIKSVPDTWIFEHYCKLPERLHGQDVAIKSLFNPSDTQPSMRIFFKNGIYRFKDFSSGYGGNAVTLVARLHDVEYNKAIFLVIDAYNNRSEGDYENVVLEEESRFQITNHVTRGWNVEDQKYWTSFNIGATLLNKYIVKPLLEYTMSKEDQSIIITGQHIYGYFKKNGELYKVYRPKIVSKKFFKVMSYIQGSEQLTYTHSDLIICSSLKDICATDSLQLDAEYLAPDSENTMIDKHVLAAHAVKFKRLFTMFDNDPAGHQAMAKYEKMYGIPGIHINLSKDVSDSVKDHGPQLVRQSISLAIQ